MSVGNLVNETPQAVKEWLQMAVQFLQSYGWFLVLGVIMAIFVKNKLQPYLQWSQKKQAEREYHKKYDAGTVQRRQEAMQAARLKLQQENDVYVTLAKEEQNKKEEEKRQQKLEDWERHQKGGGYRSKVKAPEDDSQTSSSSNSNLPKPKGKKPLSRPDYNPLMGDNGGSCSWRPSRPRGGAGGG